MNRSATRRGMPLVVQFMLSILFGLFVAGGLYSAYMFYLTVWEVVANTQLPTMPVLYLPVPGQRPIPLLIREETVDWKKKERVNLLMLGIDRRPGEHGPWRTDTMLVATVDPATDSAAMISIPRDLWVPIPGYEENRINMAHYLGDAKKYPGGGPALAKKTVQYNLGVPVNYYIRVDFEGFRQIIDTIGGIDIEVDKEIIDDRFPNEQYGYDPLYIEAGLQHMDGDLALKYARTRHGSSDFDRAKRQQQVLLAVRDKALQLNLLPKLPELMILLADTIETDLQPNEILNLAQIGWNIDKDNVDSAVIDQNMTLQHTTPTGADVLLPRRDKIRPLIDDMFTSKPVEIPIKVTVQIIEMDRLAADEAKIAIINGTQNPGLAKEVADYLRNEGYNIVETGQADRDDYTETIIVDYTGKTFTVEQLTEAMNVPTEDVRPGSNLQSEVDIRVILGDDFQFPDAEG
jgi:LCP family protein required for cell wall assembly